jgi:hypothetical protein
MSSSTKREISHDPREIEGKRRRFSRLNRKHPGSHARKSTTSTEAKVPHLRKRLSWKHFTVLKKAALRSLKFMKIVRTVIIKR